MWVAKSFRTCFWYRPSTEVFRKLVFYASMREMIVMDLFSVEMIVMDLFYASMREMIVMDLSCRVWCRVEC